MIEYLAIRDPDTGDMTYWRDGPRGLTAWPPRAKYGPVLWRRENPGHRYHIPAGLRGEAQRAWCIAWWCDVREPWMAKIREAITEDRATAGARFAAFSSRCCSCGRPLTADDSKVYAVGPECRRGVPDHVLADLARKIGHAHAEAVQGVAAE